MKILFFLLFLLAAGAVFWGLNALISRLAYDREERYLHCRLIVAVLLVEFVGLNVYTFSPLLTLTDQFINSPSLAGFFSIILPNRAYALLYMLLSLLGVNLCAALIILVTILVTKFLFRKKKVFLEPNDLDGLARLIHFPWFIVRRFYESQDGRYVLRPRGFVLGVWAGGMKVAFTALWVVEAAVMAFSILWGSDGWNEFLVVASRSWYLLPMAGFLLTEQIQFFLEGEDKAEAGTFGSTQVGERLEGDIQTLMDIYRLTFSGQECLLYSEAGPRSVQERSGLYSNDLGNRQLEDCKQPQVLSVISNQLRECGVSQCDSYQNALVELLNGRSVNVRDHSQGEFLIYAAAYLNFYLSQGRTALVLCRDREEAEHLCAAIQRQMRRLNDLYGVWNIATLREADVNSPMSMLVCSFEDFLRDHVVDKRQDFAADLFCTVIAGGLDLFSQDSIRIERLFNELRRCKGMNQFILLTGEDNDALRTTMEISAKQELLPFNNDLRLPNTCVMIWGEESAYKLQRTLGVGGSLAPYLGTALPLALVAVKFDLPQLYIIPDHSRGDRSFADALAMSGTEVSRYINRSVNLKSIIRTNPEEAMERRELSMLVAYDTDYNFFNALWRWMKYGGTEGTLIHIVSPPYLLREYFAANFARKQLLLKSNEFDALIPYQLGLKASHMAVLLVALCDQGLTEEELMEKSRQFGWGYEDVEKLLRDCLRLLLRKEELHSVYECFHFEEEKTFLEDENRFVTHTRVVLTDSVIRERLAGRSAYTSLIFRNDQREELSILRGNVTNYYLRGQLAAFGGYLYRITAVRDGCVQAEQELPQDLPQYFPISDFTFEDLTPSDPCVDKGPLEMSLYTASVTRRIYGYWACDRGTDFARGSVQINDLRDRQGAALEVRMDNVSVLELNLRADALGGRPVQAANLLAFLLNELSKTLFPGTWQNLFAATSWEIGDGLLEQVMARGRDSSPDDIARSVIPAVRARSTDTPGFVTLYIVEFSCVEYGMVQTLYQKLGKVLKLVQEYLSWYLAPEDEAPAGRYLHFGGESVPAVFAPEELLDLCRRTVPVQEEPQPEAQADVSTVVRPCTFCGRPVLFTVNLGDGRCMCGHCKDHQITQRDEIKSLYFETVEFLKSGYGIPLRKNIHVRFHSAEAIRRETKDIGGDGGRILGLYTPRRHQLLLETGGPRVAMQSTLIHELTHAWQFDNLPLRELMRKLPALTRNRQRLILLEGHAVYVEVDAMRRKNETEYADRLSQSYLSRQDEYGAGYRFISGYLRQKEEEGSHMTPFAAMELLVKDIMEGKVTVPCD